MYKVSTIGVARDCRPIKKIAYFKRTVQCDISDLQFVPNTDYQSEEEVKDQESIQSSSTPDPGYRMEK